MKSTIVVDWFIIIVLALTLILIHTRLAKVEEGQRKWQEFLDVGVDAIK